MDETISKALEWTPIEKAFSGMQCVRLALQNCGKAIDEDIKEGILEWIQGSPEHRGKGLGKFVVNEFL